MSAGGGTAARSNPVGRLLLGLAAVAVAFAAADTYVVVLALPDMMAASGLSAEDLQRGAPIVSGFLLGYVAMLPLIGRIADLRGRVPVLVGCLLLFALGSLVTAAAYDLPSVVVGRVLQGVGAGGLLPATLALVADLYPPRERGIPLGVLGAVQELGSVLGPVLGAVVLVFGTWRTIFLLNLAVGLLLAAVIRRTATAARSAGLGEAVGAPRTRFDVWGLVIGGAALTMVVLVMVQPARLVNGVTAGLAFLPVVGSSRWLSPVALAALLLVVLFVVRCLTARAPLLDLRAWGSVLRAVDVLGALYLGLALAGVILAFAGADPEVQVFSRAGPWLLGGSAVAAGLFWWRNRTAAHPLVPPRTLAATPAWGALLVSFFVGSALIAALVDIPIFARITVHTDSQLMAALVLVRFLVGLPAGRSRRRLADPPAAGGCRHRHRDGDGLCRLRLDVDLGARLAGQPRRDRPAGPGGRRHRLRDGAGQRGTARRDRGQRPRRRQCAARGRPHRRQARRHQRADHDRAAPLLRRAGRPAGPPGRLRRRQQPLRRVLPHPQGGRADPAPDDLPRSGGLLPRRRSGGARGVPPRGHPEGPLRRGARHRPGLTGACVVRYRRPVTDSAFDDLLDANRRFSEQFALSGFDGIAHAGVAIVTCMDSRIDPLGIVGLSPGDAKIFRNPGGRVTDQALEALVLAVHLLNVSRVLVIPHTRCAMASSSEDALRARVAESAGVDASWQRFHVVEDQEAALDEDVRRVTSHPLVPDTVAVGGFVYDVDTGLLDRKV